MVSSVDGRIGTVRNACAKYLIRRNAFFVLDFCLHFFWVQHIAGYQFLPPRYVVEVDGTLEFGGLIIFEVLGISGPVPAYPYKLTYIYMLKSNQKFKPSAKTLQTPTIKMKLNSHVFAP